MTMNASSDWYEWHRPYDDAGSQLSRRLRLLQRHITAWLDARPDPALRVVSICAGQGRDLLGVLADRPDAARVTAHLIESDPRNIAVARASIAASGITGVTVACADAGDPANYVAAVPADLVLLAGVLGNLSNADARATIAALPQLCAAGATVIWTRIRQDPGLTGNVRRWLAATGFAERTFDTPKGAPFTLGVHEFHGRPQPLTPRGRLFRFVA
jgi:hypothetical protein